VEVLGIYSNLVHQGKLIRELVELVPAGRALEAAAQPKRVHRRLRAEEVDAGRQFGIHRETAAHVLETRGLARRYASLSGEQIEEAKELYTQGCSLEAVGEKLGVNGGTIWRAFKQAGVATRDSQGRDR
jgi:hypothetical protein